MRKLRTASIYTNLGFRLSILFSIIITSAILITRTNTPTVEIDIVPYMDWITQNFHRGSYEDVGIRQDADSDVNWYWRSYRSYKGDYKDPVAGAYITDMVCFNAYTMTYYCYLNFDSGLFREISITSDSLGMSIMFYPQLDSEYTIAELISSLNKYDGIENLVDKKIRKRPHCNMALGEKWRIFPKGEYCQNLLVRQVKQFSLQLKPKSLG